ncbi:MAG TPA: DUF6152 family protein [Steroidobacteraceae bacterium]|nr:DUF6152 family protein [Steroidobacteraceae bacterium]
MIKIIASLLAGTLFLSTAVAHHSVAGEFDVHKTITLNGVVSKVDWVNPHIYIWLDVKSTGGATEQWHLECVPVGMARKAGLTKKMLEGNGETVTVVVFPARDGTKHLGFMTKLTFPDGHFFQFAAEGAEKKTT